MAFQKKDTSKMGRAALKSYQRRLLASKQENTRVGNFSGSVKQYGEDGLEKEEFFVGGKETGTITYNKGTPTSSQTISASRFQFNQNQQQRQVLFHKNSAEERRTMLKPKVSKESVAATTREPVTREVIVDRNPQQQRTFDLTYEERKQLPLKERIKYAYQSAGGGPVNVRGAFRSYLEVQSFITTPILNKLKIPEGPQTSTRFAEDIAITTLFSGPFTATTTQVERELFSASKVRLAGITQTGTEDIVKTDAFYTVERNNNFVRGYVSSATEKQGAGYVSAVKGQEFSLSRIVPTNKLNVNPKGTFQVGEASKINVLSNEIYLTRSTGIVKKGTEKYAYKGVGFSLKKGEEIYQLGASKTSTNQISFSVGALKNAGASSTETSSIIVGGSGGTTTTTKTLTPSLKGISLQSVKTAVGSATEIPVTQPMAFTPVTSSSLTTAKTKIPTPTEQLNKTIQTTTPEVKIETLTKVIPAQATSSKYKGKTRTISQQLPAEDTAQKNIVKVNEISDVAQLNKLRTISRSLTTQKTSGRMKFITRTPAVPKPRFFGWKLPKIAGGSSGGSGKFAVSLRRFGKFKVIGYGRTEREAINIGRSATVKTLGATFKVEGLTKKPRKIEGFRTKKTKEGELFIELPKYRLSTKTEKREIAFYKGIRR